MHLTKDITLDQFAVSSDHPYLASLIDFPETDRIKAFFLAKLVLQQTYDQFDPGIILSGKRTVELNAIVGGTVKSDHLWDYVSVAADFFIPGIDMLEVFDWMSVNLQQTIGQLIYYPDHNFIHVSLATPKHHGEIFTK